MTLITQRNLADPDRIYARILAAHEGKSENASAAFDARLILILANHIGSETILAEAIRLAEGD